MTTRETQSSPLTGFRAHPRIALFTFGYLLGFTVYGLVIRSRLTIPYAVVIAVALALIRFLNARINFSSTVLIGLSVWGLLHMAGGIIPIEGEKVLYNLWLVDRAVKFDNLVHFVGFGVGTIACWEALRPNLASRIAVGKGLAVIIAFAGMGVGGINEVMEFFFGQLFKESNVGGYVNTSWDLVFNTLGCSLAASLIYLRAKRAGPASN